MFGLSAWRLVLATRSRHGAALVGLVVAGLLIPAVAPGAVRADVPAQPSSDATLIADMSTTIGYLPLNAVVLPGTHDSGPYGITNRSASPPDYPGSATNAEI